jgi:Pterin 4 alpha carbinolamine dehydratase
MAALLTEDEIACKLVDVQWEREGDEIVRDRRFEDFAEAIAFVNRVAEAAQDANHHPDILVHDGTRFAYRSPTTPPEGSGKPTSRWPMCSTGLVSPVTGRRWAEGAL